ncbi:MAG TPA: hypothetical protein VFI79_01080 [Gemmatimonadales bacterium]|nr:hypothetical protein [Gemmatimonadales bacterium]
MKRLSLYLVMLGGLAHGLAAQGDVRAQLVGRVSPDLLQLVVTLADSAKALRLPDAPLVNKALEGAAKGVAPDRIALAVQGVFGQLNTAASVMRSAGAAPTAQEIEAGAFALGAGLTSNDVAALSETADRNHPAMAVLQVAGALAALGVPRAQTVGLVQAEVHSGLPLGDLTNLPAQVQAAAASGVPPDAAASGLERAAQAHAGQSVQPKGRAKGNPHRP